MRLRHFDADRPSADDHQMFRPLAISEDGFIRQIRHTVEPADRRQRRIRAGRDDKAPRADLDVARLGRCRAETGRQRAEATRYRTRSCTGYLF